MAGRPIGTIRGRKVSLALEEIGVISTGSTRLRNLLDHMSDRQRRLFLALSRCQDELEAIIEAEFYEYITGIAKIVYDNAGKPMRTSKLKKVSDLQKLSQGSYSRLLRIAKSAVRTNMGEYDFLQLRRDIQSLFEIISVDAAKVIVGLMLDEKTFPRVRLKAANEVLDRAGYVKERCN